MRLKVASQGNLNDINAATFNGALYANLFTGAAAFPYVWPYFIQRMDFKVPAAAAKVVGDAITMLYLFMLTCHVVGVIALVSFVVVLVKPSKARVQEEGRSSTTSAGRSSPQVSPKGLSKGGASTPTSGSGSPSSGSPRPSKLEPNLGA